MNLFYHPCMDPEIKIMEQNDMRAREQIAEIRERAKELKISAKYAFANAGRAIKEAHEKQD